MKNMSDKTKRRLVVGVSLAACAILVVLIGSRFMTEPQTDDPIPSQSSEPSDVTVDTDTEKNSEVVVSAPDISSAAGTDSSVPAGGGDDSGTEQTIQSDVAKPEYSDEQLTNPSQKPNGEGVAESPQTENNSGQSPNTSITENQPQGGDTKDGKIYVPGFGWIDDVGEGQGTTVDGDGDINKQVGEMN